MISPSWLPLSTFLHSEIIIVLFIQKIKLFWNWLKIFTYIKPFVKMAKLGKIYKHFINSE